VAAAPAVASAPLTPNTVFSFVFSGVPPTVILLFTNLLVDLPVFLPTKGKIPKTVFSFVFSGVPPTVILLFYKFTC
jgi:hypothetical protein